jgi:hypothetical protein
MKRLYYLVVIAGVISVINLFAQNNLVKDGSFEHMTRVNDVTTFQHWSKIGTVDGNPDNEGCDNKGGYIGMWGNQRLGEGIYQKLTAYDQIVAGEKYFISICFKFNPTQKYNGTEGRVKIFAFDGNPPSNIRYDDWMGFVPANNDPEVLAYFTSTNEDWETFTTVWTADSEYDGICIRTENELNSSRGEDASSINIDNVEIYQVCDRVNVVHKKSDDDCCHNIVLQNYLDETTFNMVTITEYQDVTYTPPNGWAQYSGGGKVVWRAPNDKVPLGESIGKICFNKKNSNYSFSVFWENHDKQYQLCPSRFNIECPVEECICDDTEKNKLCNAHMLSDPGKPNGKTSLTQDVDCWEYLFGTPDASKFQIDEENFGKICLWGWMSEANNGEGEGFYQKLPSKILQGHWYKLGFCGSWNDIPNTTGTDINFRFYAFNGDLLGAGTPYVSMAWETPPTSNITIIGEQNVTSDYCERFDFPLWQADMDYEYLGIDGYANANSRKDASYGCICCADLIDVCEQVDVYTKVESDCCYKLVIENNLDGNTFTGIEIEPENQAVSLTPPVGWVQTVSAGVITWMPNNGNGGFIDKSYFTGLICLDDDTDYSFSITWLGPNKEKMCLNNLTVSCPPPPCPEPGEFKINCEPPGKYFWSVQINNPGNSINVSDIEVVLKDCDNGNTIQVLNNFDQTTIANGVGPLSGYFFYTGNVNPVCMEFNFYPDNPDLSCVWEQNNIELDCECIEIQRCSASCGEMQDGVFYYNFIGTITNLTGVPVTVEVEVLNSTTQINPVNFNINETKPIYGIFGNVQSGVNQYCAVFNIYDQATQELICVDTCCGGITNLQ